MWGLVLVCLSSHEIKRRAQGSTLSPPSPFLLFIFPLSVSERLIQYDGLKKNNK
ncbi:unnamed protein product, partial [Musa banksii]